MLLYVGGLPMPPQAGPAMAMSERSSDAAQWSSGNMSLDYVSLHSGYLPWPLNVKTIRKIEMSMPGFAVKVYMYKNRSSN